MWIASDDSLMAVSHWFDQKGLIIYSLKNTLLTLAPVRISGRYRRRSGGAGGGSPPGMLGGGSSPLKFEFSSFFN